MAWNSESVVTCCPTCDGHGRVASFRRASINDPYPDDVCQDCDGTPNEPECVVCGFNQQIAGADCLVCETIAMLHPHELKAFDADKFAEAIKHAHAAAMVDLRRAAA